MAVLDILEYPDEALRQVSVPVQVFDSTLQGLVEDLLETLERSGAIGLSAPQAGVLQRVLVVHVPGDDYGAQVYINPEILGRARLGLVEESCLSVPGIVGNVMRATQVHVRAQDPSGQYFERALQGMHAVCLQHEIDHLDGKLFVDYISEAKRTRIRKRLEKDRRHQAAAVSA